MNIFQRLLGANPGRDYQSEAALAVVIIVVVVGVDVVLIVVSLAGVLAAAHHVGHG